MRLIHKLKTTIFFAVVIFMFSCSDTEQEIEVRLSQEDIDRNNDIQEFSTRISPYISHAESDAVFICVPDIHAAFETMTKEHLPFLVNTNGFNGQCRLLISAGDMLFDGSTSVTKQGVLEQYFPRYKKMINAFGEKGFLLMAGLGGHDFNNYDKNGSRDYSIANNLKKEEQRQGFIQPCLDAIDSNPILKSRFSYNIPDDPKACYYYVDDSFSGLRTIMLDETDHPQTSADGVNYDYDTYSTAFYSEEQLKWFIEALKTTPSGKYVTVHNHMGLLLTNRQNVANTAFAIKKIIAAFIEKGVYSGGQGSEEKGYSWSLPSVDFSGCNGIFGGLYKGHTHVQELNMQNKNFPQICSTNPDSYPFRSIKNPIYDKNYLGDLYVIYNKEIRNFHYGRNDMKDGGTQEWKYNAFTDRWVDDPIILK